MKFDMSITDNYASFVDKETGVAVFVDSFDNKEFDVRIGSIDASEPAGTIRASSSEELNRKLTEIFQQFQDGKGE
ncbi:hypothetical protein ACXYTJ_06215 [Gilvimarinus sp. F26214L]|uniref:hypothetical protein n=1 Tax=Gilvimarinus sp. DZF01 TaxID=3461371 RepID=UPI0040459DCC